MQHGRAGRGRQGRLTVKRDEASRVQGDVNVKHCTHTVDDGGVHYRYWCVEVAANLTAGSREVEHSRPVGFVDVDLEGYLCHGVISTRVDTGVVEVVVCSPVSHRRGSLLRLDGSFLYGGRYLAGSGGQIALHLHGCGTYTLGPSLSHSQRRLQSHE